MAGWKWAGKGGLWNLSNILLLTLDVLGSLFFTLWPTDVTVKQLRLGQMMTCVCNIISYFFVGPTLILGWKWRFLKIHLCLQHAAEGRQFCYRWLAKCNFFHHQNLSLPCFFKSLPSLVLLPCRPRKLKFFFSKRVPSRGQAGALIPGQKGWYRSQEILLWSATASVSLFSPPLFCRLEE